MHIRAAQSANVQMVRKQINIGKARNKVLFYLPKDVFKKSKIPKEAQNWTK